jgi:WD40 repeat protein
MVETATGREVARFEHGSPVYQVDFVADGQSLLTRSYGGQVRLWPTNPDWPFEQLCQRMGQNLSRAEWKTLFDDEPWEPTCPGWRNPDKSVQAAAAK